VVHAEPGGPAEKAGVLLGDVLLELDGQATADTDDVQRVLRGQKSGNAVRAKLLRGGTVATIDVTLAGRPAKSA
jgi:serine protease Do